MVVIRGFRDYEALYRKKCRRTAIYLYYCFEGVVYLLLVAQNWVETQLKTARKSSFGVIESRHHIDRLNPIIDR